MTDQAAVLRHEIARLEGTAREIDAARAEFEHEARRLGDAVERAGGIAPALDPARRTIRQDLRLNAADRAKAAACLGNLHRRLASLEEADT